MKDLCKAMGIEVEVDVKCSLAGKRPGCPYMFSEDVTCCGSLGTRKCEHAKDVAMPGPDPTDEAFCWRALQYMMGREDWARFYTDMWDKYTVEQREWSVYGYIPWLTDPARFVKLCADWCRDHEEARS
jgi:hypothetical protein